MDGSQATVALVGRRGVPAKWEIWGNPPGSHGRRSKTVCFSSFFDRTGGNFRLFRESLNIMQLYFIRLVKKIDQKIRRLTGRLGEIIKTDRSMNQLIKMIRNNRCSDVRRWIELFDILREESRLSPESLQLLREHQISKHGHAVNYYAKEIGTAASEDFKRLAEDLSAESSPDVASRAIELIIRKKSAFQCRDAHTEGGYYAGAEPAMDWQWNSLILPYIDNADFTSVLELAPGHGRNSEKLSQRAEEIHLVDVNQTCIDACRHRFGEMHNQCRFHYYVTNGDSLPFIGDETITFVYSFDSMVHFDKTIVRAYLLEFCRVMKPGATGFLHHSNYGTVKPNSDWAQNPGNRSDVSASIFANYCAELGLEVIDQRLHGLAEGRGIEGLDCVTLIRKAL